MAEILFQKVLNNEIEVGLFLEWLFKVHSKEQNPDERIGECDQDEFVTFFLNYVHRNLSRVETQKETAEMNKSQSFPLDLSNNNSATTSTPKIAKVASCPISPLDSSNSTPKSNKKGNSSFRSPLILGDFIVHKKSPNGSVGRNQKSLNRSLDFGHKKRINPTNLTASIENSRNCFDFSSFNNVSEISVENASQQRSILAKERLEIADKMTGDCNRLKSIDSNSIDNLPIPELKSVSDREKIDLIVVIYSELITKSYVFNVISEVNYLVTLLLFKKRVGNNSTLLNSVHNLVYFAVKTLERLFDGILVEFDKSTLKLLGGNGRLKEFAPEFGLKILEFSSKKSDRLSISIRDNGNVFFDCDTDNRRNFPNDRSFHAFRKQRDEFFEILNLWEDRRRLIDSTGKVNLELRIKNLFALSKDPANFYHLARLFKSQILNTCKGDHLDDDRNRHADKLVSSLSVDEDKLNKLKSRFVTKRLENGLNAIPGFPGRQEFYKEFIQIGCNHFFNSHLSDTLISDIVELNATIFGNCDEDIDDSARASYFERVKSLKLLAKFLGFLHALPYKNDGVSCDSSVDDQLTIRKRTRPQFDVKSLFELGVRNGSVILCVPWLTDYLSMLDNVTLRLPYYLSLSGALLDVHRSFKSAHRTNENLVRFCLGWLFDLPHYPNPVCRKSGPKGDFDVSRIDDGGYVDQDVLYFCCPHLDEIGKVLMENFVNDSNCWVPVRHITPISSVRQTPEEAAGRKLQRELEEAFFKNHPASLRRTVDFVSERVTSACVKRLHSDVIPKFKSRMVEKLTAWITSNEDDCLDDDALPAHPITKVDEVVSEALVNLRDTCTAEAEAMCAERVEVAMAALISDVLPQTGRVCVKLTRRTCQERVAAWISEHVTLSALSKDCLDELRRVFGSSWRRKKGDGNGPVFALPPGGKNLAFHNDEAKSGADLIEEIRDLSVEVVEGRAVVTEASFGDFLDRVAKSDSERADINECAMAAICRSLGELSLLLICRHSDVLTDGNVDRLVAIWDGYHGDTDDLLKSLLCPRTVVIFRQSDDVAAAWTGFAKFCVRLIRKGALGMENFEGQCTAIFRTDWDEESLKLITDFYKSFVDLYREGGGCHDNFPALLDFFGDFCEDL